MAFHAKLSPSSAKRWMNCPGSPALIGDESSSAGVEAMRGTAAHKIIETMLAAGESDASAYHNHLVIVHEPGVEETLILKPGSEVPIVEGWHLFVCDEIMVNGVQMMIDHHAYVRDEQCFDPVVYTERFLDMSWLDPRLGGTADDTLVDPDWAHLLDYKNGRIIVEVKDNEQCKNYAVGLLHEHPDIRGVTVWIVQPNAIHEDGCIRSESYTADELKLFEIQMKQAADATSAPNAPRRAGEWCVFCPAKIRCPEFEDAAQTEAGMDFASDPVESPPAPISDFVEADDDGEAYRAMLARKAKFIPLLDAWAKDINKAIFAELMNSRDVPGKKLVYAKSNRAYIDDEPTTAAALIEAGFPEADLYTDPKLKSPAQVEKLRPNGMKAAAVKKVVGALAFKPQGKITVADADDARPALDPAAAAGADFAGDDPGEFEY